MAQDRTIITQDSFGAAIEKLGVQYFGGGDHKSIALAVSGGVDSMCMAYMAQHWASQHGVAMVALIVDHRLRTDSTSEAIMVRKWLENRGIDAHVIPWVNDKPKSNIHQFARTERYRLLTNYCKANNISLIMTAHNSDDQAETIMMRISRGTGITGLVGIKADGLHNGVRVLRPMLSFSRKQIVATMELAGWEWVDDPSNYDPRYTRTTIRAALKHFPNKELLGQRCNLLAHNMDRVESYLILQTERFIKEHVSETILGNGRSTITIDHQALFIEHEEIGLRVLRLIFQHYIGSLSVQSDREGDEMESHPPRLASLERLYQHLVQGGVSNKKVRTMGHCKIWAKHGLVYMAAE